MKEGTKISWIDVVDDDYWWTNFITGVKFGKEAYSTPIAYALTDTGTSCTYVPSSFFNEFEAKVLENVDLKVDSDGYAYFSCDELDNLPKIELLFGGYWMQMIPEDYVLPFERRGNCGLCIFDGENEEWLLGSSFLRGFYAAHDHASKRFGFAPHSRSSKKAPYKGAIPDMPLPLDLEPGEIAGIVIAAVVAAAGIAVGLYFLIKR